MSTEPVSSSSGTSGPLAGAAGAPKRNIPPLPSSSGESYNTALNFYRLSTHPRTIFSRNHLMSQVDPARCSFPLIACCFMTGLMYAQVPFLLLLFRTLIFGQIVCVSQRCGFVLYRIRLGRLPDRQHRPALHRPSAPPPTRLDVFPARRPARAHLAHLLPGGLIHRAYRQLSWGHDARVACPWDVHPDALHDVRCAHSMAERSGELVARTR